MLKHRSSIRLKLVIGLSAVFVAFAVVGLAVAGLGSNRASFDALQPENFSALHSTATRLDALPPGAQAPSPELAPAPGAVHSLGHGKAVAWIHAGETCWSTSNVAGCVRSTPLTQHAVDSVLSDPDQVGSGKPASVFGLAVDEVIRVTAKLQGGATFSVAPVDNWYEIELPDGVAPWSVTTVDALLANGKTVTYVTRASAPAVLSASPPKG